MNRTSLAAAVALLCISGSAFAKVPTGSFIRRPVHSVAELVRHVETDSEVRDRYFRHFRLTPTQISGYFKSLHLARLTKDGVHLVFNVREDKVIRGRYLKLKKGTLVFADGNGRPILQLSCGNPLVMSMPGLVAEGSITEPLGAKEVAGDVFSSEDLTTMIPGAEAPVPIPPVTAPVRSFADGSFISGDLGLGPLLLGLGIGGFLIVDEEDDDNPPVPEPATFAVIAVGITALLHRRRRRS